MLIGSVAIALGALVPYLWPTLTALHFTSVLIGSGFMMYQVAAQNIIGYIGRPEDRPMTFSLAALGFSISGFVGPMLAGFGIDAFGHIATFGIFAAFPLLPIAVLGLNKLRLPQPHTHAPPPDRAAASSICCVTRAAPCFRRERPLAGGVGHVHFRDSDLRLAHRIVGVEHPASFFGSFSVATFVIGTLPAISRRLTAWPATDGVPLNGSGVFFLFPLLGHGGVPDGGCLPLGLGSGCRSRWSCP